jgi:hypothetical protein
MFKKKNLRLILLLLLLGVPAMVHAQFTFVTNNETIIITGYTGTDSVVNIPDMTNGYPVTSIGDEAFFGDTNLVSVTLPGSLTNIGIEAFNSCLSLTNIMVPASVISIGDYAFFYCTNLSAITVDAANPFYSSLDGVLFNHDQTTLIQFPFAKNGSYSIPGTVTNLADGAFGKDLNGTFPPFYSDCPGLTNLIIPGSLANLPDYAFSHCGGLTSVTLSSGVASLGTEAFSFCFNLTSVAIPDSVTNIGELAFYYSGLTNATIPGSVINLGLGAFAVCGNLSSVTIQDGVGSIGEAGFNFCTNLTSVTIPDSVTSVGERAFWFCSELTNAIIGSGVTNVGSYAFSGCGSLLNIEVNANNLFYSSDDGVLFNEDQSSLIQFPGGKGGGYTVPEGVTNIADYAFGTLLGDSYIFYPLAGVNLTNIIISSSVTTIGDGNFPLLNNLTNIYFEGDAPIVSADEASYGPGVTFYRLPGTTGWDSGFAGYPTTLWLPQAQAAGINSGGQFGFNINWASGQTVVVEACTNLSNPQWQPVYTNTFTTGLDYFSDSRPANVPGYFYRLRSP